MDTVTLDRLLNQSLLVELGEGLDSIAGRLAGLYDGWRRDGADESSLAFIGQILGELGWWSGRAEAAASALAEPLSEMS